jgi:O-antigen/teichoic acid export membrane protein
LIALPWLLPNLLGAKYEKASFLVPLWGVYFLITSARDVGTTLLTAFGSFMALFKHACVSLVILLIACFAFMPAWGTTGALVAMIVVEVYRLAFECLYLLPRSRNKLQNITN